MSNCRWPNLAKCAAEYRAGVYAGKQLGADQIREIDRAFGAGVWWAMALLKAFTVELKEDAALEAAQQIAQECEELRDAVRRGEA